MVKNSIHFFLFSVEPRVITLLAHCRELQPTRRISITSLQKRYSVNYSKDDEKITYYSSQSDPITTTREADDPTLQSRVSTKKEIGNSFNSRTFSNSISINDGVLAVGLNNPPTASKDIALQNLASKEETAVPSQTQPSPITQNIPSSAYVQPDPLKTIIVEDMESEELAIVESKAFTKGESNK